MADYFVASGGSNTAPYETWAKAATSLATALAAASTNGDRVIIQHDAVPTGDQEVGGNTTYAAAANVAVISASNDGGSSWTPTPMGTANWIGNSTASFSVTFNGAFLALLYGLTLRTAGSSAVALNLNTTDNGNFRLEDCYFWLGTTSNSSGATITLGGGASTGNYYTGFKNCTFRFGNAAQELLVGGAVDLDGCVLSSAGSVPNALFLSAAANHTVLQATGCDFSHVGANPLVNGTATNAARYYFDRCKIGTGALMGTISPASKAANTAIATDCSNGDTHGLFAYADAFGTLTSDTTITYTGGAAGQSWKIVTTANCSRYTPFVSPWVNLYNTGTSAITPRLEILRDGSATAYTDAEVWGEFMAKVTAGSSRGTLYDDEAALSAAGTAQDTGAGLGSWTGENATAWSGKVDSGSSLTPAEVGDISARVCVGVASATVYVDPFIRT